MLPVRLSFSYERPDFRLLFCIDRHEFPYFHTWDSLPQFRTLKLPSLLLCLLNNSSAINIIIIYQERYYYPKSSFAAQPNHQNTYDSDFRPSRICITLPTHHHSNRRPNYTWQYIENESIYITPVADQCTHSYFSCTNATPEESWKITEGAQGTKP
jgi:hypothetical protein